MRRDFAYNEVFINFQNMKKQIVVLCLLVFWLWLSLPSAHTQAGLLQIYFVDIGQGHATLIVSPTGKTLLVDGGPEGSGSSTIVPLMKSLGLTALDVMVATHYDADHIGGLDEVARAFPPGRAYDSGDLTATSNGVVSNYLNAIRPVRTTIRPGLVLDLGGGAFATCIVVNGDLISGGRVGIFGRRDQFDQLGNSSSVGLLIQFGDFDFFVSGDLSGGGNNTTDVESTVGQLVGDVDVLQLNHHGSSTSSNPVFLNALKAEVGIVQAGRDNSFSHPTIEVIDRFINTTPTSGITPMPPDSNSQSPRPPFVYQNQPSPDSTLASDQGIVAGGTFMIQTEGQSYEIRGAHLVTQTFPTDGAERGIRTDFAPSVIVSPAEVIPAAGQAVPVGLQIADDSGAVESVTVSFSVNAGEQTPLEVRQFSNTTYSATIPGQTNGTLVQYRVRARDGAGQVSEVYGGYFAGTTPIQSLRANDSFGLPRYLGFPVRISGVVTAGSGIFASQNNSIYVQDTTGGINFFQVAQQATPVATGDVVIASGRLMLFNGVLELDATNPLPNVPFTSPFRISKTSGGGAVDPIVKRIADIGEATEGLLVRIEGVRLSGFIPPNGSDNLTITDGTGQLTLRIVGTTDIPGMPTPEGRFSIVGVIGQFDRFRPFNQGYQILPRNRSDFILP
jgi:beta-lactamase superfamily II metal-dependent hydrolase